MVVHAVDGNTPEAEVGGSLSLSRACCLHSEFQASQGYIDRPCLKKPGGKGPGKLAQQVRTLVALPEDSGSIHSLRTMAHNHL